VIYVVKDLIRILTYRNTLEYIQAINPINVIYVVKNLVWIITYRNTSFVYHHSVVIQHLVSDKRFSLISKEKLQNVTINHIIKVYHQYVF
jgi:hypothetical protein